MPIKVLTKIELQECVCNGELLSFIEFACLKSYEIVAIVMAGPRWDRGRGLHDNRHGKVSGRSSGVCYLKVIRKLHRANVESTSFMAK